MKTKNRTNPFYVLLVLAGMVFVVTATAYGIMTYRDMRLDLTAGTLDQRHPLWEFMRDHGNTMLMIELAVLGVATLGAIATESFWKGDATHRRGDDS